MKQQEGCPMAAVLLKFATQADPWVLDEVRAIAVREGEQLQAVIAAAAALFESLAMNHPFVDAKMRIAFACVEVFLRVKAFRLHAKPMALHKRMISPLRAGTFYSAQIEPTLRNSATPV
jgi:prophage maintenance system killer protein